MLRNVFDAPGNSSRSMYRYFWVAVLVGILLSLILTAGSVLAAPAAPDPVRLTQPDGTVLVTSLFGDEWYSGYEYQGYTILLDQKSGYWVYAEQDRTGRLVPGWAKAGIDDPFYELTPHLRDTLAMQARPDVNSILSPDVWPGTSGTHKVLIILADFTPSVSLGTTDSAWNQLFFDNTAGVKSVRNYYREASFNQLDLEPADEWYGTSDDGVIAVTLGYVHPDTYPTGEANRWITRDALVAADSFIDYASFDTNGNGSLDGTELHLIIIARGYETSYTGTSGCAPSVWGHRGALGSTPPPPTLDGVVVAASQYNHGYAQVGEWHERVSDGCDGSLPGHLATMGIMVHEMGHDIDWPDLYDTDGGSSGVGYWSIMSGGSWGRASGDAYSGMTPVLPDAFLKWYQGWITPTPVTAPRTNVAIPNATQNPTAYLLGFNPGNIDWDFYNSSGTGEYFLVENRQLVGFDAGLWRIDYAGNAHGCIIWHIDETRTEANTANANPARKLVDVEEADGTQDMDTGSNYGDDGDPWPGSSGNTAFNAASTPNSNWYNGSVSGIAITDISASGTGCTVDFSGVGPTWDGSEGTNWTDVDNWTVGRVPNQNDNTVIPSGVPNWPNVNAAAAVGNLNILTGAHATADANASLEVYGNWAEMGSGYFDASAGTVAFLGSNPQSITSRPSSHFNDLQIGNGSTSQTVTASSDLDVDGDLSIQLGASLVAGGNTLRVGGNWTNNPFGFVPGSSTVILDGTTQAVEKAASEVVVYSNDVSSTTGWAEYDANGGGDWGWYSSVHPPNTVSGNLHARYFRDGTVAADDWLFSPGFTLEADVSYTIRFNYGASSASRPERLAAYVGGAQNVGAMTTQVFDDNNFTHITWQEGSGTFTPGTSGTYYVGFYVYSDANMGYPSIDDLVVAASDPDLAFYNLSVANTGTATLSDNTALQNDVTIAGGGTLALGSQDLTVEGSVTNEGSLVETRVVNAASTTFLNIQNAAGTEDKYFGVEIDPGTADMGSTTVAVMGNQYCSEASRGVMRCFELDPTTSQTAAVTFYYTEAERNGVNNSAMQVYHWNGSSWESEAGATTGGSGDAQWVRVTGVDDYSPFSLNSGAPTATILSGFDGSATDDGSVSLEWQTASEIDVLGFNLYRAESETGIPVLINDVTIPSQWPGSTVGGSYTFEDQTTTPGTTYYYWIEVVQINNMPVRYDPIQVVAAPVDVYVIYLPLVTRSQ